MNVYIVWFLFLCLLPVIVFFRLTRIDKKMITLDWLELAPQYNADSSVMCINVNFSTLGREYLAKNKRNIILKILKNMLDYSAKGVRNNPEVYLCKYKHLLNRFWSLVFIGSFIPLIIVILHDLYLYDIVFSQLISFALVAVVYRLFRYKYEVFYEIFYKYWYDRILNFDLISTNALRPHILNTLSQQNNNALLSAAAENTKANARLAQTLLQTTNEMSRKLGEFLQLQQAGEEINPQNTIASFDGIAATSRELNAALTEVCEKIDASFEALSHIVKNNKTDINAINKNTASLVELKTKFAEYKNEAVSAEIAHLAETTAALRNNATNSFAAIEASVKQNAENLSASYAAFFEMCKTLKNRLQENPDSNIERIMLSAQETFARYMKELENQTSELSSFTSETPIQAVEISNSNEKSEGDAIKYYDIQLGNKWRCGKCGFINDIFVPVCKKCGKEFHGEKSQDGIVL